MATVAGLLAFLANAFGYPVLGEMEVVFGGGIALLVAIRHGSLWGAVVAALAAMLPAWRWGLPIYVPLLALLAAYVGRRKGDTRPSLLLRDIALFWTVAGVPLLVGSWLVQGMPPFPTRWLIAVKLPLNSLLDAFVALELNWTVQALMNRGRRRSLRELMNRHLMLFGGVPLLVVGMVATRVAENLLLREAQERLRDTAVSLGARMDAYLDQHFAAIEFGADALERGATHTDDERQRLISALHANFPGFLTMLVTDAEGRIVTAAAEKANDGVPRALFATSVADRSYFTEPRRTGKRYVSGVFRGRGFGSDLIVALSVPYRDHAGAFAGVVEGSLDLGRIAASLPSSVRLEDVEIIVTDRTKHIVTAHKNTGLEQLRLFSTLELGRPVAGTNGLVRRQQRDDAGREAVYVGVAETSPQHGWLVFVQQPLASLFELVFTLYAAVLSTIAVAGVAAHQSNRTTLRRVTEPLERLAAEAAVLQRSPGAGGEPLDVRGTPEEIAALAESFAAMALALRKNYQELQALADERGRLNGELQAVLADLDERVRERTAELERAREEAVAASRAKDEFLATMSHELRTPLNGVLGFSELLGHTPITPQQRKYVETIRGSGQSLLSLINDILDVAKIEAGKLRLETRRFDVREVVNEVAQLLSAGAAAKSIALERVFARDVPLVVSGDISRTRQALVNLVGNAVKFTLQGGVTIQAGTKDGRVRVEVRDTGVGIAPEAQERVFQKFMQADSSTTRRFGGTGLGLAITKRIIELMHGSIGFTSEPGRGSTFWFELPAAETADEVAPRPTETINTSAARGDRVLLVEDDETNQLLMQNMLERLGCTFDIVRNGMEAVERSTAHVYDVVLMDLRMPVMDGYAATTRIRAVESRLRRSPRAYIVALTADAMPTDRERCLIAGMDDHVPKPVSFTDLEQAFARHKAAAAKRAAAKAAVLAAAKG